MNLRSAVLVFSLVTAAYVVAFVVMEKEYDGIIVNSFLFSEFPILLLASLLSFFLRYLRWIHLLSRAGESVAFSWGFVAYLSGFAFTATPGKVGELVRIRYFSRLGVEPWKVIAAFVFERVLDLVVVLMLASFLFYEQRFFYPVCIFVFVVLAGLMFFVKCEALLRRMERFLHRRKFIRAATLFRVLRVGLGYCGKWLNVSDIVLSFLLGLVAWSVVSVSFVYLLSALGILGDFWNDFGTYPLAMLAGAASMLPGGVGSTEAAITFLLNSRGVTLNGALLAAISIRISTLWFAMLCGFVAAVLMEIMPRRRTQNLVKLDTML